MDEPSPKEAVHFLLTDEYLAVANTGKPFTKEGVRAICQAHLSSKQTSPLSAIETSFADETDSTSFLSEIRTQRLEAYRSCPDDIREHAQAEEVLRKEYAGRILPELLQNANDATGGIPIGNKGVGFKGVLNITDAPRIHSGVVSCDFDRGRAREALVGFLRVLNGKTPLLRLPFPISKEAEPPPIRELIEKYDTVIVLPFRNEETRRGFISKEWNSCIEDRTFLLFLPAIDRIIWERHDKEESSKRISRCTRIGSLAEIHDENDQQVGRWKLWNSPKASVALRLDEKGISFPEEEYPKLRVFFQTVESTPIPVLIHGDLPLKEGRDHVLLGDPESRSLLDNTVQEVASQVRLALSEIKDPGRFLDLIRPRIVPEEEMGGFERELWQAIKKEVITLEIPNTGGVRIDEVRLRPNGLWWFECNFWNDFKTLLKEFRPSGLSGLPFLPPGVDTEEREKTILALNPSARLSVEELPSLPLLPVEGCDHPVASGNMNVFFPPKALPPPSPPEVDISFLAQHLAKALEEKNSYPWEQLVELLGISKFEPLKLVEKAILPALRKGHQPDGLLAFLCAVIAPELKESDLLFDWRDPVRKELAERCLVPLRDGRKLPVAQIYAGHEWTGSDTLDQIYEEHDDRGFLHPPPEGPEDRQQWEKFFKWLGVGWCPKVLPIVCHEATSGTHQGMRWSRGSFPISNPPERWTEYCAILDDSENEQKMARLRQNWDLDGSCSTLASGDIFSLIAENWQYYAQYKEAILYRSSNVQKDYDNNRRAGDSYFFWLLKIAPWIPIRDYPEKQKASTAFSPGSEIPKELRGWAFELEGEASADFLKAIGIRLGWRELEDKDWHRWLGEASRISPDTKEAQDAIRRLYGVALRHWKQKQQRESKPPVPWTGPLWSVERRPDNTEKWCLATDRSSLFFVDRLDVDLHLPGLCVFPERLGRLEKAAAERFQLKKLSEHLNGKPSPGEEQKDLALHVQTKIDSRLQFLYAYLQTAFPDSPSDLLGSLDAIVLPDLTVQFFLDSKPLGHPQKPDSYYRHDSVSPTLWLAQSLFKEGSGELLPLGWEEVAGGLANVVKLPLEAQANIAALLSCPDEELRRRLLRLGVTQEIIDRISFSQTEERSIPIVQQPNPPLLPAPSPLPSPSLRNTPDISPMRPDAPHHPAGSESRPQGGREAQEWMRDQLRQYLSAKGWEISEGPIRDEESRETDIQLAHPDLGTFHVEVKHMESGRVFWSENEVSKAQDNRGHYLMVVLKRAEEGFEEFWSCDPLFDFGGLTRRGRWTWSGQKEEGELSVSGWEVPEERPTREANFSFQIDVDEDWLDKHRGLFSAVCAYLERHAPS